MVACLFKFHLYLSNAKRQGSFCAISYEIKNELSTLRLYMYSTDYLGTKIYDTTSGVYESQDNVKNNLKTIVTVGGSTSNYLLIRTTEN